jgi:hypothetical protein
MERSARMESGQAIGKSSAVHDAFGLVAGKQTLTMGLGVQDGINVHGGGGRLVDKTESTAIEGPPAPVGDQVTGSGSGGAGSTSETDGGGGGAGSGSSDGAAAPIAARATFAPVAYATTPPGVGRRIPPRKDVVVNVTITGLTPSTNAVISLAGAGAGGNATIDGGATKSLAASGNVTLRGTAQTAPGSAGALALVAKVGGTEIGRSNGFTICAIPTTVSVAFGGLITGDQRGIEMTTSNDSDSGSVADLDQVHMSEMVKYQNGTGCFAGITSGDNSGYLHANATPHGTDSHGTPVSLVTSAGYIESVQAFKFKDARAGAADIGVNHSGFMIKRTAEAADSKIFLTTSKAGAATTVSGISVSAGTGSASKRQEV